MLHLSYILYHPLDSRHLIHIFDLQGSHLPHDQELYEHIQYRHQSLHVPQALQESRGHIKDGPQPHTLNQYL